MPRAGMGALQLSGWTEFPCQEPWALRTGDVAAGPGALVQAAASLRRVGMLHEKVLVELTPGEAW